jgi:hypothetical protein
MLALHLCLHIAVPGVVAAVAYRSQFRRAWLWMMATVLVDLDHLWATPIYNSERCSIGFHPLHSWPAIALYGALLAPKRTRIVALGLLIHMAVDGLDCL